MVYRLFRPLMELLYPPECASCGATGEVRHGICPACWDGLAVIPQPQCSRCGRHLPSETIDDDLPDFTCGQCRARQQIPWIRLRSLYRYESPLREVIHQFKFYGLEAIGAELAERFSAALGELAEGMSVDLVVPVPTGRWRLLERGFNPAAVFARAAAAAFKVPCAEDVLTKVRQTPPQSRLEVDERRRNLRDAFLARRERIKGMQILLVDDVITTGATIDECARALKRGGARTVSVITLARADHF